MSVTPAAWQPSRQPQAWLTVDVRQKMTPAERIEIQFGKWNKKFPLAHCTILTKEQVAAVAHEKKTAAIVTVRASDGRALELFPTCLTWDGRSIDYRDIERQEWIDLEHQDKVRNKQAHFDRVHIVTRNGITTLDGLGQAVFPLMKSIDMILKRKIGRTRRYSTTTPAVTSRACARPAPAGGVADLGRSP